MSQPFKLHAIKLLALDALTWRARVATSRQLLSLPGASQYSNANWRRHLRQLRQLDLVNYCQIGLRLIQVHQPLHVWKPEDVEPQYHRLAWQLEKRWSDLSAIRTVVYWATSRAALLTGGVGGRLRQPCAVEHDLGVTSAYVARCRRDPATATSWISEDVVRRDFSGPILQKIADAAIVASDNHLERLIEFGGQYRLPKLQTWHRHCHRNCIAYELW